MWIFSKTFYSSSKKISILGGFTVIELMVASSIIIIMTTVLLFRHERFNSSTILRSLAYGVALSVRQAQLYGTSVRETDCSGSSCFPSYALYFKFSDATHYFLGADINGDGTIEDDGSEDITPPSPYKISSGYKLKSFCAKVASTGADHCYTDNGISDDILTTLTLRFLRPNPDALIVTNQAGVVYSQAYIQIESPGEDTRGITITSTGQISVGLAGT